MFLESRESPESKIRAFYQEFPYLHRIISPRKVWKVGVRRWDDDLLTRRPIRRIDGDFLDRTDVFFLGADGEPVVELPKDHAVLWQPWTWFRKESSVQEKIEQLGEAASRVTCIVTYCRDCVSTCEVVVWKPARGHTNLRDWFTGHTAKAIQGVHAS